MLFYPVFYGTGPDRIKWPNFDKIPDRTNVDSGPVPDTGFGYFIRSGTVGNYGCYSIPKTVAVRFAARAWSPGP